jgi:4-hydroxybenzoate polyprenyltransferase/phosphoserine phosphatase
MLRISKTVTPDVSGTEVPRSAPLYVDMDGTVLATDVLWEMLIVLLKTKPALLFRLPSWLLKGKAFFKQQLAAHIAINPAALPYHEPVVAFLDRERQEGRQIILATASDQQVAASVAGHLGLFSTVLASDGRVNLSGCAKLTAIVRHADGAAFDYIGNSWADLPIWERASHSILVQPSRRLQTEAAKTSKIGAVFCPRPRFLIVFTRMLRIHQWSKNVLLLVPLVLAHKATEPHRILAALLAFVAFSLASSGVYIVNDLIDLESDRHHPHKRSRPLAAGLVPIPVAIAIASFAIASSIGIAGTLLPRSFLGMLLLYVGTTTAYSFVLKRVAILDVVVLAGLYTIRILAGAVAVGVPDSPWFLAFSMFFFLSLAFVKRYAELRLAEGNGGGKGFLAARGYQPGDLDLLRSIGAASGYVAVVVFALYINSPEVHTLYRQPFVLWLIGPILLYWVTRVWFLAHRGRMHGDPVVFALSDPPSYFLAVLIVILLVFGSAK